MDNRDTYSYKKEHEYTEMNIDDHVLTRIRRFFEEDLKGNYGFPKDRAGSEAVIYYIVEQAKHNPKK